MSVEVSIIITCAYYACISQAVPSSNLLLLHCPLSTAAFEGAGVSILGLSLAGSNLKGCPLGPHPRISLQPQWRGTGFYISRTEARELWSGIPQGVDVVVTHSPAEGHGDAAHGKGCKHLLARIEELRPKLHVFGHEGARSRTTSLHGTIHVNAAVCGGPTGYDLCHPPVVVDLPAKA
jgi:hypothetical protein